MLCIVFIIDDNLSTGGHSRVEIIEVHLIDLTNTSLVLELNV